MLESVDRSADCKKHGWLRATTTKMELLHGIEPAREVGPAIIHLGPAFVRRPKAHTHTQLPNTHALRAMSWLISW